MLIISAIAVGVLQTAALPPQELPTPVAAVAAHLLPSPIPPKDGGQ
jgi:hypothetical protein